MPLLHTCKHITHPKIGEYVTKTRWVFFQNPMDYAYLTQLLVEIKPTNVNYNSSLFRVYKHFNKDLFTFHAVVFFIM